MTERKSTEELESTLNVWRNLLNISSRQGVGKTFRHLKSGDYYVAWDVGFDHENLSVEVEYSPLRAPAVRFHREVKDFQLKFSMVAQQRV